MVVITGEGGGTWWVEARAAAQYPTVHRTSHPREGSTDAQTSVTRKHGLCPYVRPEVDKWPYSPSNLLCNLPAPVFFLPRVPASAPTLPLGCSVNPRSPQTTPSNILGGHARDRSSQRFYSWPLQWPGWGRPPSWALRSVASTPHGTFSSQFLNHRISPYCPFSPDPTLGSRFPSPNDG